MSTTIIGFPRLGEFRELACETLEHCQRARHLRNSFK